MRSRTRYRSISIIQPAAGLPVTMEEAKKHLRVDITDDDSHIQMLVASATRYVERRISVSLVDTRYEMRLDEFPAMRIELPVVPFSPTTNRQQVEVEYMSELNETVTMTEGGQFLVDRRRRPPAISPMPDCLWPSTAAVDNAVTIRWWSGFGETGASVPATLKSVVLGLSAYWYSQREAVSQGNQNTVPYFVDELLSMEGWGEYR